MPAGMSAIADPRLTAANTAPNPARPMSRRSRIWRAIAGSPNEISEYAACDAIAAVSAVLKAPTFDEMLGLQTSWPRTAEQLLQESAQEAAAVEAADTAALQAGELVTPAQEAARASLAAAIAAGTPPVPMSLVLQAKALMARVPEIVAEREGGS